MDFYKPEFTMDRRKRRGETTVALWVTMPDGVRVNIWDLETAPGLDVQNAIQSAFRRGFEAAKSRAERALRTTHIQLEAFNGLEDES